MVNIARGNIARGPIVEVGVYCGASAWDLAGLALEWDSELHLFDTFSGIPYRAEIDTHVVGDFGDVVPAKVRHAIPMAHIYQGVFPETLPDTLVDVALVHVDCDQYQSVLACIDRLGPRMQRGGIMFFDDYELPGCAQAIKERGLAYQRTAGRRPYTFF